MPHRPRGERKKPATARDRLIAVSIEVFSERGYTATTTRMLAVRAKTQLTGIAYHFGNKEGIYHAAAAHIAAGISAHLGPRLNKARPVLHAPATSPEARIEGICNLLEEFLLLVTGPEIPASWSRFMSRELLEPTPVAFPLLHGALRPMGTALCGAISALSGRPPEHRETILRMLLLVAQVLVFRSNRAAALRFLGWQQLGPTEIRAVRKVLRNNVKVLLRSYCRPAESKVQGAPGGAPP